jgi:hypothetical protein
VFTQWIYKNQKSKIVDFEITGENDFVIHLDEAALIAEGKGLITKLLLVLQTYKSSGSVERGKKFYDEYSEVSDFFLKIREIVLRNKKPRRLELNNNLVRYNEKSFGIRHYPETHEGIIHSYADRHQFNQKLYNQVMGVWDETKVHLRVRGNVLESHEKQGAKELKQNYVIDNNTKVLGSNAFGKVFLTHNKHN